MRARVRARVWVRGGARVCAGVRGRRGERAEEHDSAARAGCTDVGSDREAGSASARFHRPLVSPASLRRSSQARAQPTHTHRAIARGRRGGHLARRKASARRVRACVGVCEGEGSEGRNSSPGSATGDTRGESAACHLSDAAVDRVTLRGLGGVPLGSRSLAGVGWCVVPACRARDAPSGGSQRVRPRPSPTGSEVASPACGPDVSGARWCTVASRGVYTARRRGTAPGRTPSAGPSRVGAASCDHAYCARPAGVMRRGMAD